MFFNCCYLFLIINYYYFCIGSGGDKLVLRCACGRRFTHRHHYNFHAKWECGKKFLCPVCKHAFTQRCSLLYHMKHSHPQFYTAYRSTPSSANDSKNHTGEIRPCANEIQQYDVIFKSSEQKHVNSTSPFNTPQRSSSDFSFKPPSLNDVNAKTYTKPTSNYSYRSLSLSPNPLKTDDNNTVATKFPYNNLTVQNMNSSRCSPGYRSLTPASSEVKVSSSSCFSYNDNENSNQSGPALQQPITPSNSGMI